ncbi:MAG: thioredoxin-dependent thiol peroxidase [Erysipelothrix sp.]|nr:thioredoxin-dependent thiol peroxidase [Erysipelothrix sp.]
MLKIRDKAPEFTLTNQDGNSISLDDYKGKKVVLYFYPKDNTSGCTAQACSFRDYNDVLKEMGVVVLGVSKDSQTSHEKFSSNQRLNFDILSDPSGDTMSDYGVFKENSLFGKSAMGVDRTTYIIDENGYIEHIMLKVNANDNAKDVVTYLKNL